MNDDATRAGRYARQVRLPEIGAAGQDRLARGRVLVVGVGGLGSPAAIYLAAAGVGTIGVMDGDVAEVSNLQRQIAYRLPHLGRPKAYAAAEAIGERNPEVVVHAYPERLTAECLARVFADYDFVVDGVDGAAAKFLINDGAVLTGKAFSHAGALGWHGQTMTILPAQSACYRCLFPVPPDEDLPTCQMAGIIGPVVGAIGLVQASEALKFLLGAGELLTNRLLMYDGLSQRWRSIQVRRSTACPLCGPQRTITSIEAARAA